MPLLITFCVLFYRQPAVSSFLRKFDEWLITKNREREKVPSSTFSPRLLIESWHARTGGTEIRAGGTAATILTWNKDALYCIIICREHSCRSFVWMDDKWSLNRTAAVTVSIIRLSSEDIDMREEKTIISLRHLTDLTQASFVLLKMINFIECVIIFYWLFPYWLNTGYIAQFTCNQSLVLFYLL